MIINKTIVVTFMLLTLNAASNIYAQPCSGMCPRMTPSGLEYMTGGIGDDETELMKSMCSEYSLCLAFAQNKTGAYLDGVEVTITNEKSNILMCHIISEPMLLLKLPKGKYIVSSSFEGKTKSKKIAANQKANGVIVMYFD